MSPIYELRWVSNTYTYLLSQTICTWYLAQYTNLWLTIRTYRTNMRTRPGTYRVDLDLVFRFYVCLLLGRVHQRKQLGRSRGLGIGSGRFCKYLRLRRESFTVRHKRSVVQRHCQSSKRKRRERLRTYEYDKINGGGAAYHLSTYRFAYSARNKLRIRVE